MSLDLLVFKAFIPLAPPPL